MNLPRIGITMGDVNGIGPELVAKLFAHHRPSQWCYPVVIGSASALDAVRALAPGMPPALEIQRLEDGFGQTDHVPVFNAGAPGPRVRPGTLDPDAGRCAVHWIETAVSACLDRKLDAMVTCPISKECIYRAGSTYTGHTEMVAALTGSTDYRMCLFAGNMRIVHLTGHLSLRDALDCVRRDPIVRSVEIGCEALRKLGIEAPRIAVAGLNPHAGEAGAFGREEIDEIAPAVELCRAAGVDCTGPLPPDTVFRMMRDGLFDLVVAMYHDQGHIPLKLIAMDEGVNVTLGTSIVRTSVDHGTAFDIAGQGIAREGSLISAIQLAIRLGATP